MGGWRVDSVFSSVHKMKENCDARGCRPVVVIDPESAEDVERLLGLYVAALEAGGLELAPLYAAHRRDAIADALREFAAPTPPRPDEPQGLGAVVEDADGRRWVRVVDDSAKGWRRDSFTFRSYANVDAVRVLSEGVTP